MSSPTFGEQAIRWADGEPSIALLVAIGSQVRAGGGPDRADAHSDWDFQVATSQPELFAQRDWAVAQGWHVLSYVVRPGRLGSAQKVTALFQEGELDLVIIPLEALRGVAQLVKAGQHSTNVQVSSAVTDLAAVLQGGYRIIKGAEEFGEFYATVGRTIPPPRLSDEAVRQHAEGFVCDYVSTCRKIDRGEYLAAQRWLHRHLAETNFSLLHELRQRGGMVSFPDARRLELLGEPRVAALRVDAPPDAQQLRAAVQQCAETFRGLVFDLVGPSWQWPDLSALGLRAE